VICERLLEVPETDRVILLPPRPPTLLDVKTYKRVFYAFDVSLSCRITRLSSTMLKDTAFKCRRDGLCSVMTRTPEPNYPVYIQFGHRIPDSSGLNEERRFRQKLQTRVYCPVKFPKLAFNIFIVK
ncbi:hypothetical protein BaRGS_00028965, partial [Batillaria attramentaria]